MRAALILTVASLLLSGCGAPETSAPEAPVAPPASPAAATRDPVAPAERPDAGPIAASRPADLAAAAFEAVTRSLPAIEREGDDWMEGRVSIQGGRSCVSCHHVGYAIWSHEEARRAGIGIPEERIADLTRRAVRAVRQPGVSRPMSTGPLSISLSRASLASVPDVSTADLARLLRDSQESDGHYRAQGQFPDQRRPESETDVAATIWTVLAIAALEPDAAIEKAQARALAWLDDVEAGDTTETVAVLALLDAHRDRERAAADHVRRLVELQNLDGGWGWRAGEPSNALTTGQALYALAIVGGFEIDPDLRAGVAWLIDTQQENGRWDVPSARISSAASSRRNTVYGFWGTAWASIALSRCLPRLRSPALDLAQR